MVAAAAEELMLYFKTATIHRHLECRDKWLAVEKKWMTSAMVLVLAATVSVIAVAVMSR